MIQSPRRGRRGDWICMRLKILAAGAAALALATASAPQPVLAQARAQASNMTVREFLTTADRIPRNATALVRPDTRRLMGAVRGAFGVVRDEEAAARTAGRPPATCVPERVSVSPDALLRRFNAIPEARRNITVTQAVREWMAEAHPCPR